MHTECFTLKEYSSYSGLCLNKVGRVARHRLEKENQCSRRDRDVLTLCLKEIDSIFSLDPDWLVNSLSNSNSKTSRLWFISWKPVSSIPVWHELGAITRCIPYLRLDRASRKNTQVNRVFGVHLFNNMLHIQYCTSFIVVAEVIAVSRQVSRIRISAMERNWKDLFETF